MAGENTTTACCEDSGRSKNFEGGGTEDNLSAASFYRKCTQRSVGPLHEKRRLFWKKLSL